MILFPSIDLKDGYAVRFIRGSQTTEVRLDDLDVTAIAKGFVNQGFKWLHVVDLNGATTGKMTNSLLIEELIKAVDVPIQLGGGIRDFNAIEAWLTRGIRRVILGTAAQKNPALVRKACQLFPNSIAVSIDARGGRVATSGWSETTNVKAIELALRYEDAGAAAIIYTDIGRNGTLTGINVPAISDLAFALTTPVIAAGGLASIADIEALCEEEASGIVGVICGRALYDGRVIPSAALSAAGKQDEVL